MAYLKLGDVRKFETPHGDFVGMVARCKRVHNTAPEKYGYIIVTTSGIETRLLVGDAKISPAEVSPKVRKLLREMCEVSNAIEDAEEQVSKYTDILTENQKKRSKLWDALADIHYNRVK